METILQFGAGRFLRAFADFFIHEANRSGTAHDKIVVVQSTEGERARALAQRGCRYHVALRGIHHGALVDQVTEIRSISRALVATSEWDRVLAFAREPQLQTIISNTTEAGYELQDDTADDAPPKGFPAKLLQVLRARFYAGLPAVTILPCELFEHNALRLREQVIEQARRWNEAGDVLEWIRHECRWRNSLVDRIVSGVPAEHPLLASDPLLIAAEPYALWAIELGTDDSLTPSPLNHPAIHWAKDIMPFHLRKVRILNGAHTALVCKAMPMGFRFVREAIEHAEVGSWLRHLLFDEIVPVVAHRSDDAKKFAEETLERFLNPFLDHKLSDIALHHEAKVKIRLVPTRDEYKTLFGKEPPLLSALLDSVSN